MGERLELIGCKQTGAPGQKIHYFCPCVQASSHMSRRAPRSGQTHSNPPPRRSSTSVSASNTIGIPSVTSHVLAFILLPGQQFHFFCCCLLFLYFLLSRPPPSSISFLRNINFPSHPLRLHFARRQTPPCLFYPSVLPSFSFLLHTHTHT